MRRLSGGAKWNFPYIMTREPSQNANRSGDIAKIYRFQECLCKKIPILRLEHKQVEHAEAIKAAAGFYAVEKSLGKNQPIGKNFLFLEIVTFESFLIYNSRFFAMK